MASGEGRLHQRLGFQARETGVGSRVSAGPWSWVGRSEMGRGRAHFISEWHEPPPPSPTAPCTQPLHHQLPLTQTQPLSSPSQPPLLHAEPAPEQCIPAGQRSGAQGLGWLAGWSRGGEKMGVEEIPEKCRYEPRYVRIGQRCLNPS